MRPALPRQPAWILRAARCFACACSTSLSFSIISYRTKFQTTNEVNKCLADHEISDHVRTRHDCHHAYVNWSRDTQRAKREVWPLCHGVRESIRPRPPHIQAVLGRSCHSDLSLEAKNVRHVVRIMHVPLDSISRRLARKISLCSHHLACASMSLSLRLRFRQAMAYSMWRSTV